MRRGTWILLAGAVGIVAVTAFVTRSSWMGGNASAQGPQRPRTISVELAKAERKPVPVDVDAIGMVTPISSVALKARLETTIIAVHFEDGAKVSEGDLLFTLDSRQIDAQIEQAEGVLAKDQAQLEGAQRDLRRFSELVGKGATTQVNVDNARTQSDILIGTIAMVENTVDMATGMVTVRGIMNNENETLWPGTLVATKLVIRTEDSVVVPTVAVQRSQSGNFVFVVKDGTAKQQPVKVDRTSQGMSVISEGLAGDEAVVVDGQLLLSDGTRIEPRAKKAGA